MPVDRVPTQASQLFAWQGWELRIPPRWGPVRLEGDYRQGGVLLADLSRKRLELRWQTPSRRRFNAADCARGAMRHIAGALAASEARPLPLNRAEWESSLLYVDLEMPGRDVWCGYSRQSGRLLSLIYHTRRRERALADSLLPALRDLPTGDWMPWAVFELNCAVPPGFRLQSHCLNAGDLSLTFSSGKSRVTVRQIAVAGLALQRQSLDKWLIQQKRISGRHYRATNIPNAIDLMMEDRVLHGLSARMVRRRRFFWARRLAPERFIYALHDEPRDRLVFVDGTDLRRVQEVAQTVGVARSSMEKTHLRDPESVE